MDAPSPSSSPTSVVALHQDSARRSHQQQEDLTIVGKRSNTTRQDLVMDESSTSNPQQGTSVHSSPSSELEGFRAAEERTDNSRASRSQHGGASSISTKYEMTTRQRQKRPPRLIETRPNMKIPPTHKDNRKLFVGGLPVDVTSEEFYRYFLPHGAILDSVVMFDKATQRCRGFGFVTFEDPQVCADLLKLGGADEATSEGEGVQNGYLEMRGKVIEIKRAQPKSTSSPGGSPTSDKSSTHSGASHHRRRSDNAKSYSSQHQSMDGTHHGMTYESQMSYEPEQIHHNRMMSHRQYVPATPMPGYGDSGSHAPQMTPQQAVLDLAHHMLFYSQLLATPTLMSHHLGMVSPMMSPSMMGVQAYNNYFQPFYDENATHSLSPVPPKLRKVPEGESFEIGGGKFFRETPLSPTLDSSQPSLRPVVDEKRYP